MSYVVVHYDDYPRLMTKKEAETRNMDTFRHPASPQQEFDDLRAAKRHCALCIRMKVDELLVEINKTWEFAEDIDSAP